MKKLEFLAALAMGAFLVSCSSDEVNGGKVKDDLSNLKIGSSITADFGNSSMSISSTSNSSNAKKAAAYEETETGYFYVRVDSKVPDTYDEEQVLASNMVEYYPQTTQGRTDFTFVQMQKSVYPEAMGEKEYLLDAYGRYTVEAFAESAPTMDDVIASFKGGAVTYHGNVIYDPSNDIDELDGYKVIWYVVKRVEGVIHVDGALVPVDQDKVQVTDNEENMKEEKGDDVDKTDQSEKDIEEEQKADEVDIVIPIDVTSSDMILEADDFAIRKSGVSEYIATEKVVDANTLEYNGVTITRGSDMQLKISGLDNLDWSEEETVWTFDTYLWAKFDLVPSDWAMDDDVETTIDDDKYNIECHYFTGFQSEGSVPYIKVSVHVSQKVAEATEPEEAAE